jgi:hypothetical protein
MPCVESGMVHVNLQTHLAMLVHFVMCPVYINSTVVQSASMWIVRTVQATFCMFGKMDKKWYLPETDLKNMMNKWH